MMNERINGILGVFDFDWTIVDDNSDTFFLEKLEPKLLKELKEDQDTPWTSLIDHYLGVLHEKNYTSERILSSLEAIPLDPDMKQVIQMMGGRENVLRIVSDANNLFIERILGKHSLLKEFDSVTTNPAHIEKNDRIRLKGYHSDDHGCDLCPPNLCKGKVVKEWGGFTRVFYFGDGWGDLCPVLGLGINDIAFVRSGKSLSKHLNSKEIYKTKAKVVYWTDSKDLLKKVREILFPK